MLSPLMIATLGSPIGLAALVPSPSDPEAASEAATELVVADIERQGAVPVAPVCTVPESVEPGGLIACYLVLEGEARVVFVQFAADESLIYLTSESLLDRSIVPETDSDLLAAWDSELSRILAETAKGVIGSQETTDQVGVSMTNVECERPTLPEVGATFTCTAYGDDGQLWSFGAEVDAPAHVTVTSAEPADTQT